MPATVRPASTSPTPISLPSPVRSSALRRMATREWPPQARKSSSGPGSPVPNASAQAAATPRSVSFAAHCRERTSCGGAARRARRADTSTLPAAVSGSTGSRTTRVGTMYAGMLSRQWARTPSMPGASCGVR